MAMQNSTLKILMSKFLKYSKSRLRNQKLESEDLKNSVAPSKKGQLTSCLLSAQVATISISEV
jgi:hypothetical protein